LFAHDGAGRLGRHDAVDGTDAAGRRFEEAVAVVMVTDILLPALAGFELIRHTIKKESPVAVVRHLGDPMITAFPHLALDAGQTQP